MKFDFLKIEYVYSKLSQQLLKNPMASLFPRNYHFSPSRPGCQIWHPNIWDFLREPKFTETDLKKSQICPNLTSVVQTDWMKPCGKPENPDEGCSPIIDNLGEIPQVSYRNASLWQPNREVLCRRERPEVDKAAYLWRHWDRKYEVGVSVTTIPRRETPTVILWVARENYPIMRSL